MKPLASLRAAWPITLVSIFALGMGLFPPAISAYIPHGSSIKDAAGRDVSIKPPAKRIVMFPPVLWEYLAISHNPERVIAGAGILRDLAHETLLGQVFPFSKTIPLVVTKGVRTAVPADPEDVMRYAPDAVLSWDWLSEPLRIVPLPVVGLSLVRAKELHGNDITNLRVMASVANEPQSAETIVSLYRSRLADISARVEVARKQSHPPHALHASIRNGGQLYIEAAPFLQATALEMAGAETAQFKPAGTTDFEQLLIWDPDVIVLSCCYGDRAGPNFFYDDARFQSLRAVKARRIYKAPSGGGRMEGLIEWPLLVSWIAEILYPDHMPKTFRADLVETYSKLFNYALSEADVDNALFIDENGESAGFERFKRPER